MAYEKKDGDFALFKNDRKKTEKHPDYTGDILLDDTTYYLDAWIKKTEKGTFMTGRVGKVKAPKQSQDPYQAAPTNVPPLNNEFEDEIPF